MFYHIPGNFIQTSVSKHGGNPLDGKVCPSIPGVTGVLEAAKKW